MTNPAAAEPFIDTTELDFTPDDQVAWATARIREYCRWHIYPSITDTRTVLGDGGRTLILPTLLLTGLGPVVVNTWDPTSSAFTDVTLDAGVLGFETAGIVTRRDAEWPVDPGTIAITYTHGYATLPEGIRSVVVSVANRLPRQMSGATLQSAGGVSMRYENVPFTLDEQVVLDAYRLYPRP